MLPKKNRADKKTVEKVFKKGHFVNSPNLNFKFILYNNSNTSRISFVVPKSVSKKAVGRNRLRRRGYNALEKYIKQFPLGLVGVFVFKKLQEDTPILEDEIKNILDQIN